MGCKHDPGPARRSRSNADHDLNPAPFVSPGSDNALICSEPSQAKSKTISLLCHKRARMTYSTLPGCQKKTSVFRDCFQPCMSRHSMLSNMEQSIDSHSEVQGGNALPHLEDTHHQDDTRPAPTLAIESTSCWSVTTRLATTSPRQAGDTYRPR